MSNRIREVSVVRARRSEQLGPAFSNLEMLLRCQPGRGLRPVGLPGRARRQCHCPEVHLVLGHSPGLGAVRVGAVADRLLPVGAHGPLRPHPVPAAAGQQAGLRVLLRPGQPGPAASHASGGGAAPQLPQVPPRQCRAEGGAPGHAQQGGGHKTVSFS